ncbi:MAG: hypothetical protein GXO28_01745 [Methanopyri archaeon]|nr:hypothetical protein [Methanopyri archaeon]
MKRYYERLARDLVEGADWATFNGTVRVVNGRLLAYVHVTPDDRGSVVVPKRYCPGLRRGIEREIHRRISEEGVLTVYLRLLEDHVLEVFDELRDPRVRGHTAGDGSLLTKVRLIDDRVVLSVLKHDDVPFAFTLGFPLGSDAVYALDHPAGSPLVRLEGDAAEAARLIVWRLGNAGVVPELPSSRF